MVNRRTRTRERDLEKTRAREEEEEEEVGNEFCKAAAHFWDELLKK